MRRASRRGKLGDLLSIGDREVRLQEVHEGRVAHFDKLVGIRHRRRIRLHVGYVLALRDRFRELQGVVVLTGVVAGKVGDGLRRERVEVATVRDKLLLGLHKGLIAHLLTTFRHQFVLRLGLSTRCGHGFDARIIAKLSDRVVHELDLCRHRAGGGPRRELRRSRLNVVLRLRREVAQPRLGLTGGVCLGDRVLRGRGPAS